VLTDTGEALDGGSADGRLSAADLRAMAAAGVVLGPDDDGAPRTLLDETDVEALRNSLLADPGVQALLDTVWPPLTPAEVVADLLGDDERSAADIPLLDEAAALTGHSVATYGHVVVDEAQELSEMDWRVLMRRCPSRSFTVVGDLAQRRSVAGATSWDTMLEPYVPDRWVYRPLPVNYRTPAEIMTVAAALLAEFAPGVQPPDSVRSCGVQPWSRRIAEDELPSAIEEFVCEEAGREGTSVVIGPPGVPGAVLASETKGLEFDAVLVVEPERILASGPRGAAELYVALTRATQRLGVLHQGPLPQALTGLAEIGPPSRAANQ
jgi:hypothetical protein